MNPRKLLTPVRKKKDKDDPRSKEGFFLIERRKRPRFTLELPLDYSHTDNREEHGGIATNASEGGLLVYLPEVIEKGALLRFTILFVKGEEASRIKGIARVTWCDLAAKAVWGEYRYGLEFQSFNKGSLDELKILLREAAETTESMAKRVGNMGKV